MARRTIILNFPLRSNFGRQRDWGRVRENNVHCFLLIMAYLLTVFLFIMVEFEKVLYSPNLKMVLIFLVTKVFHKGTMFK